MVFMILNLFWDKYFYLIGILWDILIAYLLNNVVFEIMNNENYIIKNQNFDERDNLIFAIVSLF